MKLLDADRDKLIIELSGKDWREISCLFAIIGGLETPKWWLTENGEDEPELTESKFETLRKQWRDLTKAEDAKPFFVGK